ncbi:hypothetical protein LPJ66_008160 [Kickxella alabastrina]|uniref:Uncharacterized protein n=1 Tax=Kickxella alabastrina TaxID=61397 RepID=A0ACC1I7E6_9FUNG|nr:hypothetical protein LPJ66_008160 [Kickxella alabastrina]
MLRELLLPKPKSILGCIPLGPGTLLAATALLLWHLLSLATGFRSPWALYSLWMAVSSAALLYGQHKRDLDHVHWFAMAVFADIFIYAVCIPYESELRMTDFERCEVAMTTNPMSMEYCLEHVHEIKAIAFAMRCLAVLAKVYLAAVARSYELACGF